LLTLFVCLCAIGGLIYAGRKVGAVLYDGSIAHEPVLAYLLKNRGRADERERALDWGRSARPSWLGELVEEWFADEPEPELRTEGLLYELRARAEELRYLRAVARLTSFMGVLGALGHMLSWWIGSGFQSSDEPIDVDPIAELEMMQESLLCLTVGTVASSVIIFGMYIAYRRGRGLVSACVRVHRSLGAEGAARGPDA